ncbi:XRE family transcriptional regulator [Billgrantia azerbaijanica]|nr:XRE family transcriptional regulator [Halomonas azerbaijanica]
MISTIESDGHPTPERIRESREAAGISLSRAAHLVRTAPKFWQRWEAGERTMPLHRWELWCYKLRELKE